MEERNRRRNKRNQSWIDARSYREREIPLIIPTIHLGEKASELERKGIKTKRGNIKRAIEKYNSMIMKLHDLIGEIKWELKRTPSNSCRN